MQKDSTKSWLGPWAIRLQIPFFTRNLRQVPPTPTPTNCPSPLAPSLLCSGHKEEDLAAWWFSSASRSLWLLRMEVGFREASQPHPGPAGPPPSPHPAPVMSLHIGSRATEPGFGKEKQKDSRIETQI